MVDSFVRILVCRLCDNSFALLQRELPDTCPLCKEPAHWRVADPTEYTPYDMKFLRSFRIAPK